MTENECPSESGGCIQSSEELVETSHSQLSILSQREIVKFFENSICALRQADGLALWVLLPLSHSCAPLLSLFCEAQFQRLVQLVSFVQLVQQLTLSSLTLLQESLQLAVVILQQQGLWLVLLSRYR